MKNTLVYFSGGDEYSRCEPFTPKMRKELDKSAKSSGHIGYLSGFKLSFKNDRYENETVICYFKERPNGDEIRRRRANGFKAAKWITL
jgi:hypothetical protein